MSDAAPQPRDAPPCIGTGERLRIAAQYLCPTHLASALMFRATRIRFTPVKNRQIRWFLRRFGVDMSLVEHTGLDAYPDFNSFFTRRLRADARPVAGAANAVASPADGEITALGDVRGEELLQAKGRTYTLSSLLGGEGPGRASFAGGKFFTVYLHPRDYHRVHMPLSGRLCEMIYVPGRLFSVNRASTRVIPRLFTRNERVVCVFDADWGRFAVVLVGALCVGRIETVWAGTVTPRRERRAHRWRYDGDGAEPIVLQRGAELGCFNMGSTVIVLLPPGRGRWRPDLGPGRRVRMGEQIGELIDAQ